MIQHSDENNRLTKMEQNEKRTGSGPNSVSTSASLGVAVPGESRNGDRGTQH